MKVLSVNSIAAPNSGLSLANGVITVTLTAPASPAPQAGQLVSIFGTTSVPDWAPNWQPNENYYLHAVIVDSNSNRQMCIQAGVSGAAQPAWATAIGATTSDGTVTWIVIDDDISWSFDGEFHIAQVISASQFKVTAASQFTYYNPLGNASGGNGTAVIMVKPEPILELHNVKPSPAGLIYETTLADQPGVFVVTLQDNSAILNNLWNALANPNQLSNPQLFKIYVRLIDTQSYYGVQFNGLYPVLAVLGPNSFAVSPPGAQYLPNDYGGGGICEILASLSTMTMPGFLDTSDAMVASGVYAADDTMVEVSYSSKFAAIRDEVFDMGYYRDGDQVPAPVSPVDGYQYSLNECGFDAILSSSNPVSGNSSRDGFGPFTPGTKNFPNLAPQVGNFLVVPYQLYVDPQGKVTISMYTNNGISVQGAVRVICTATRQSLPTTLPVNPLPAPP
jgi:hypothetical protein